VEDQEYAPWVQEHRRDLLRVKAHVEGKLSIAELPTVIWDYLVENQSAYYAVANGLVGNKVREDNEEIEDLVRQAKRLLRVWRDGRGNAAPGGQDQRDTEGGEPSEHTPGNSEYFEVEFEEVHRERQRVFAAVMARRLGEKKEIVECRRNYLGGETLVSEQAHALIESPAARYFPAHLFWRLKIPVSGHRAEIVGQYEVQGGPDIDHRVTVKVHPPGTTQRARYSRHKRAASDGDEIDVGYCVYKDLASDVVKAPSETPLCYRDRKGFTVKAPIWPGSLLDDLRRVCAKWARMYRWKEEDMLWTLLTGEPPRLSALTLNVSSSQGGMTVTLSMAPWVPPEKVEDSYRKAQQHILPKRSYPTRARSLAVLRFVEDAIRKEGKLPPWPKLWRQWNERHPQWAYGSYRELRQNYHRSVARIVDAPLRIPVSKPSPVAEKS
jgi:hypothetical protein